MLEISVDVAGEEQLNRAFSRFGDGVKDLKPAWQDVSDFLFEVEASQFQTRGAAGDAGTWRPLSPIYAAYKAKVRPNAQILVFDSRMRRSLTEPGGDHLEELKPQMMRWGTKVTSAGGFAYPLAHQKGTSRMPARPVISLREMQRREVTKIIQRYLVAVAKREGLL